VTWPKPDRWAALWSGIGASGDPSPWYERLTAAHAEPQRHYHNQQHIAECLAEFDAARHLALQPEAVEVAIWFHDAVYDPKAADNEEQSAELAKRCLTEANVSEAFVQTVSTLILATKTHEVGRNPDAAVLVDVDLSILGKPKERFLEYESQIRKEYGWVPRIIFGSKRAKILEQFLARDRIYTTDWFHQKYEQTARHNLQTSIRQLKRWF
jgi:predicted metal-dependent HD superfamily phosphohydrolase